MVYLIKYAEIGVKGDNRKLFEEALVKRIKEALWPLFAKTPEKGYEVVRARGRIYVETEENPDVLAALQKIFGISEICPSLSLEDEGFDKLSEEIIRQMERSLADKRKTFKVKARRARKDYPLDSMEIDRELGERILAAFPEMRVDVHHPELLLEVEIREKIFVYWESYEGPGGMPVGTAGKALLLLSGGIDSPVAGYMIAKRGVRIDAVYFHAPPYTSERAKQKVVDLAKCISAYAGKIRLHIVNFTKIQMEIYEKCPHDELTIIMRRYMMRIAEKIASESDCLGLITGESIGQVASQTMQSLACTDAVCSLPVYRPLIGFDKQEIIRLSQKIGSYETSILPYEDCCTIFVAKHPVTKPKKPIIEKHEKALEEIMPDLWKETMESIETLDI
ncbi:MAG: tRNA 4-thiouridine(8) synthase ThiI [Lachnospiraceae bacterium]|nr:tRNA 4-thiouridine(8) synthase ThiI [Lachnospiraceae bacterium]